MEQNEGLPARKLEGDFIKKHFNYPMLLLSVYAAFKVEDMLFSLIKMLAAFFTNPAAAPGTVLSFIVTATPLVLLGILWLDRFEKIKNVRIWIGSLLAVVSVLGQYLMLTALFAEDAKYDMASLAADALIQNALCIVLETALAVILLVNLKKVVWYYIAATLGLAAVLIWGISVAALGHASIFSAFADALLFLALWYVPKLAQDRHSAEISPKRGKVFLLIIGVVVIAYITSIVMVALEEVAPQIQPMVDASLTN